MTYSQHLQLECQESGGSVTFANHLRGIGSPVTLSRVLLGFQPLQHSIHLRACISHSALYLTYTRTSGLCYPAPAADIKRLCLCLLEPCWTAAATLATDLTGATKSPDVLIHGDD